MKIGNREIGLNHPPYIIAEIGVNHDGDVERALQLTDAAADANADAVKLQFFETDRLMSKAAKLAAYQKNAGETDPIEMLRRLELNIDEMAQVVERAHTKGIHAIVTVFSTELVEIAETLPWDAYKTASPDIMNKPLLEALMHTSKPMIVSTGASTTDEVVQAVGWLETARNRLAVLQCVSSYPAPDPALGGMRVLQRQLDLPIGYSDHTKTHKSGRLAVAFGACVLEKHITDNRNRSGPDHLASLLDAHFAEYIKLANEGLEWREAVDRAFENNVHLIESGKELKEYAFSDAEPGNGHPAWYGIHAAFNSKLTKQVLDCEQDVRTVSRQSVVSTTDIPEGTTITRDMLTIKRPGTGILACDLESVIGCTTAQPIEADVPINAADLVQFETSMARL
ncbi:MAG: N-acetylneuraminate synthase family protein [Phycisphaerales bacterium]|nr:N-acetylneuraminate synthase family protein [Phycisphaerales bacterium]